MGKSHLLSAINQALSDIMEDGTHDKIVERNIQKVLEELNAPPK